MSRWLKIHYQDSSTWFQDSIHLGKRLTFQITRQVVDCQPTHNNVKVIVRGRDSLRQANLKINVHRLSWQSCGEPRQSSRVQRPGHGLHQTARSRSSLRSLTSQSHNQRLAPYPLASPERVRWSSSQWVVRQVRRAHCKGEPSV